MEIDGYPHMAYFTTPIKKTSSVTKDTNFSGRWSQADANNVENFISCTGHAMVYVGCLLLWFSKLQTEIDLSKTES